MVKRVFLLACSFIFFCVLSGIAFGQTLPKKTHQHEVSLDSAKKFIKNLENDAVQMKMKGGMFFRDVFDKILSQKGCVGIRYYYAKLDNGSPTLVIVGVDSTGKDMMQATIGEAVYPCPPFCDAKTSLGE